MTRALTLAFGMTLLAALIIATGTLSPPGQGGMPLLFTDKQLHFIAFALLALPLGWARPAWAFLLVPVALSYGAMIEMIQPAIGRSAELGDLVADALGIAFGVLPGKLRHRIKQSGR